MHVHTALLLVRVLLEVVAVAPLLVVVAADSAAVAVAPSAAAVVPVRGRGGQRCWWGWVGRLVSLVVLNCCTTATAVIVGGGGAGSRASSTASPGTTVVGIVVRGKPPPLPPVISIIVRRIACEKNEKNGWEKKREERDRKSLRSGPRQRTISGHARGRWNQSSAMHAAVRTAGSTQGWAGLQKEGSTTIYVLKKMFIPEGVKIFYEQRVKLCGARLGRRGEGGGGGRQGSFGVHPGAARQWLPARQRDAEKTQQRQDFTAERGRDLVCASSWLCNSVQVALTNRFK